MQPQWLATMEMLVWWVVLPAMKVALSSAMKECGVRFVPFTWTTGSQQFCAGSWDSMAQVSNK